MPQQETDQKTEQKLEWDFELETGRSRDEKKRKKNKENKTENESRKWIVWGICICLLFSAIFTSLYGIFYNNSKQNIHNPIETSGNISWVYENTFLLYRDLYNKVNHTDLSFQELYFPPTEGNEWIWDTNSRRQMLEETERNEEVYDSKSDEEAAVSASYEDRKELAERFASIDGHMGEYFNSIESTFSELNNCYDYMIEDLESGVYVSNLPSANISYQDQYFYLSFLFDEDGNVTVEEPLKGDDEIALRKYANSSAHDISLESVIQEYYENNFSSFSDISSYFDITGPKNCRVIYCISNAAWTQMRQSDYVFYMNMYGEPSQIGYYMDYAYSAFYSSGIMGVLFLFMGILFLLAFFLSQVGKGEPWKRYRLFRLPLEIVIVLGVLLLAFTTEAIIPFAYQVCSGRLTDNEFIQLLSYNAVNLFVYSFNILAVGIYFFCVWFLGIYFRGVRVNGIWESIKTKSVIYRIFPFAKRKTLEIYDAVCHFDVTKKAHKLIFKIVLVNGVVLFVIGSLWVGGFPIAVVYSILLYLLLRKYISDLQKKYGILLGAINKIANGDLNVYIAEDLGVFEPFKPQVIRIQNGFRKAVDEEVKSQRMKAELITNVSHDLKTPLTAIITYINLLKEENVTEKQREEYLNTLERKSLRLKVLIEDLFEVSKANSKNITLNIVDADIINLLRQVEFEMSDKLKTSQLDVRMRLPEQKVILPLDPQKTYRIYENLFGNIAKYALKGTRIYVDGILREDEMEIILKNITAEEISVDVSELTERFVRGDESRNTEGSGLGLAIAKSFTELQGGKLDVQVDGDLFKVRTIWKLPQNQRTNQNTNQNTNLQ